METPPLLIAKEPFPTAPGLPTALSNTPNGAPLLNSNTPRGFVIGRYAECYLFGAVVANLFDWEVKPTFDYANLSAHGDYWQVNAFLDAGWTARAKGYLTLLGASYMASGSALTGGKIPAALTFTGWSTIGNASGGANPFKMWEGSCFVKDFSLLVPMAMVEQEISLIGTGTPGTIG